MFDRTIDDFVYFGDFGVQIEVNGRLVDAIIDSNDDEFKNSRQFRQVLRVRTRDSRDIDKDTFYLHEGLKYRVYKKDVLRDGLFTRLEAETKNAN